MAYDLRPVERLCDLIPAPADVAVDTVHPGQVGQRQHGSFGAKLKCMVCVLAGVVERHHLAKQAASFRISGAVKRRQRLRAQRDQKIRFAQSAITDGLSGGQQPVAIVSAACSSLLRRWRL